MERYQSILKKIFICCAIIFTLPSFAGFFNMEPSRHHLFLQNQPGFFRFNVDNVKMPRHMESMGLLGATYLADLSPYVYGGVGTYASITGTQGGLFVLGIEGGLHTQFAQNWWADTGVYLGGGGGRASLVGGGFMLRPHAGIEYDFNCARVGLHYSYISFPSGKIHSSQIGLDLDIPFDFYYVPGHNFGCDLFNYDDVSLPCGGFLDFDRNEFGLLLQAYFQNKNTTNVENQTQNGTIGLVGAELDHYFEPNLFWYLKGAGAFRGIPNGYMDILAGLGWRLGIGCNDIAFVPQFGVGAGGGGNTNTGGGILVQPQVGIEVPLTRHFATRVSGGYLWSPKGKMNAYTLTATLLYHMNTATMNCAPPCYIGNCLDILGWRIHLFNQTYFHPQREEVHSHSAINLFALQIDQLFTPYFFMAYQGAFAYSGKHAGGYATGMIGPGLQTPAFACNHVRGFAELLVGAGGGGNLALGGGAIVEPVVGLHFMLSPCVGVQASVGDVKSVRHNLNAPTMNLGLTINFGTLNRE